MRLMKPPYGGTFWSVAFLWVLVNAADGFSIVHLPPSDIHTHPGRHLQLVQQPSRCCRQSSLLVMSPSPETPGGANDSEDGNEESTTTQRRSLATFLSSPFSSSKSGGPLGRYKKARTYRPEVESGLRYRSDDWLRNFLSLPTSFLLRQISFHLLSNVLLSLVVIYLHYGRNLTLSIPILGHSLLGSFLGLLLVFRTNTAYDRYVSKTYRFACNTESLSHTPSHFYRLCCISFYEARDAWSDCMSMCRNIALTASTHVSHFAPDATTYLCALAAAFPQALAHRCLSSTVPLSDNVIKLIDYESSSSRKRLAPWAVLCRKMHSGEYLHSALWSSSYTVSSSNNFSTILLFYSAIQAVNSPSLPTLDVLHLLDLSNHVAGLVDVTSRCEKILQTPVPFCYSRHTSRFLTVWCGMLPFALIKPLGLMTLPLTAITCWCLFSIEEIGHLIEQPFVQTKDDEIYSSVSNDSHTTNKRINRKEGMEDDDSEDYYSTIDGRLLTRPWDIGLPVLALANQIQNEVECIAACSE